MFIFNFIKAKTFLSNIWKLSKGFRKLFSRKAFQNWNFYCNIWKIFQFNKNITIVRKKVGWEIWLKSANLNQKMCSLNFLMKENTKSNNCVYLLKYPYTVRDKIVHEYMKKVIK